MGHEGPIVGREREIGELTAFVAAAEGRALVLRGEPGVGKSALLDVAAERAADLGQRVVRAAGVEAEAGLAFAGLHQLLHPLLADAGALEPATRAAFDIVFGRSTGEPPSVMTLGVAVLDLLALASGDSPRLALVTAAAPAMTADDSDAGPLFERAVTHPAGADFPIGHSFGGLIAQKLLGKGLARAAVAVDPAQIKGVRALPPAQLRAGFPVLGNPANRKRSVSLTPAQFRFGFGNALEPAESDALHERFTIPSPGRPLFEAAFAAFPRHSPAEVATRNPDRGHSLTVDHGWRAVAEYALDWLDRQGIQDHDTAHA
ncbi:ATP-binding protein [Streptomyces nigra]|uniref:ATP-binding protein n=1 Tax=Streptomyces nigra TaxID=1827580 RepID=UPI00381C20B1